MTPRTARFAAAVICAALASVVVAPAAGAQTGPYGSTTTTTAPGEVEATCKLSVSKAKPGEKVTAKVTGVFFGERVRILFDDQQVGAATAPAVTAQSASGAVALGGHALPDQATSTSVTIDFIVPKSAAVGTHIITAVGDTFTSFCNPRGEFTVLAAATGSLARTGVQAALLLVVAAVLLLVGRTFVNASRRRRRGSPEPVARTFSSLGR